MNVTLRAPRARLSTLGILAASACALAACSSEPDPPDYDVDVVDLGAPGEVTPPGTQLAFGEPAWVEFEYTPGTTGVVGVAVLEVREGEEEMFEDYDNAEDFAGYTPYYVVVQLQYPGDVPDDVVPDQVDVFPVNADGSDAEYLTSGIGIAFDPPAGCDLFLPPYDPATGTLTDCVVGLTRGGAIAGALYNAESAGSVFATEGNPYAADPVVWTG